MYDIPLFCQQRSPLGKACTFGRLEVVNLLLERGAEMKPRALEDALKEGYEYVC
jgi:ankyrin repeat protein